METLGVYLSNTFNEYKKNAFNIFYLSFFFLLLPSFFMLLFRQFLPDPQESIQLFLMSPFLYLFLFFAIINGIALFFFSLLIYGLAFSGKKSGISEWMTFAKSNFFRLLGYSIVYYFFIVLLFLLLVVPGIIFSVFWIFGVYFYLDKKTGIFDSLSHSKRIVKGRWWKIFGYLFMISLVTFMISFVLGIVVGFLYFVPVAGFVFDGIFSSIASAFTLPFTILFFKNVYQSLR